MMEGPHGRGVDEAEEPHRYGGLEALEKYFFFSETVEQSEEGVCSIPFSFSLIFVV